MDEPTVEESPFHPGEQLVQSRYGVREKLESAGRRVIRDFMSDQHREFFETLPLIFLGALDRDGRPWATALSGDPGFVRTPTDRILEIAATPQKGDPLAQALEPGAAMAVLGLEFPTRRRNRANGRLLSGTAKKTLRLGVEQSFGNCPKYIQVRHIRAMDRASVPGETVTASGLDRHMMETIRNADTFFITSANTQKPHQGVGVKKAAFGVDVSHRGGKPGFVTVEDAWNFTYPDYSGNFYFNTLGNLVANPASGYLFPDFESGAVLQLTGRTEIIWEPGSLAFPPGAQRMLRFTLEEARFTPDALPFRWSVPEFSPHLTF